MQKISVCSLPDDLVYEVLARLPPHSLMRFRCVSKSWHALVDNPEFIQMHLNLSTKNPNVHEYVSRYINFSDTIYSTRFDSSKNFSITEIKDCPAIVRLIRNLVGCCNGLLCLETLQNLVIVWNPWIRKHVELPYSPVQSKLSGYRRSLKRFFYYGFGYDDTTDDYKVVRLVEHDQSPLSPAWCEVKIYSLNSKSWKRLEDFPYRVLANHGSTCAGVFSNFSLHWIVEGDGIAAIDLRTEEYRFIPKPELLEGDYSRDLGVLDGCLCILSKVPYFNDPYLKKFNVHIWIMKDYGIKDSWSKLSVEVSNVSSYEFVNPIGYLESSKKHLVLQKGIEFQWYDIEHQILVQSFVIPEIKIPFSASMREGYDCVRSLVQPNGVAGGGKKGIKRTRKDRKSGYVVHEKN